MIYDVVVIGAGVIGLSTAWRLGERGLRVLVLDRGTLGSGTSGHGVGGVRQQFGTQTNIQLSQMSLPVFVELGERIGFRQHGYLYLALSEATRKALWTRAATQQAHGVPVEVFDVDTVQARFPYLYTDDVNGATFCASDGYLIPRRVVAAYAEQARAVGVEIAEGVAVVGIDVKGNRVAGVRTSEQTIGTHNVVNAAGPWAASVAAIVGVELPVVPLKRQAWLTATTTAAPPTAPLTIDADTGWHFRPRDGALIFAMHGAEQPGDESLELDPALAERMLLHGRHRLPALTVGLAQGWAGLYEMTPDAHPILGPVDELAGFFVACGFSGHGLMHSPAVGKLMAAVMCGEAPALDMGPLGFDRFREERLLRDETLL